MPIPKKKLAKNSQKFRNFGIDFLKHPKMGLKFAGESNPYRGGEKVSAFFVSGSNFAVPVFGV